MINYKVKKLICRKTAMTLVRSKIRKVALMGSISDKHSTEQII